MRHSNFLIHTITYSSSMDRDIPYSTPGPRHHHRTGSRIGSGSLSHWCRWEAAACKYVCSMQETVKWKMWSSTNTWTLMTLWNKLARACLMCAKSNGRVPPWAAYIPYPKQAISAPAQSESACVASVGNQVGWLYHCGGRMCPARLWQRYSMGWKMDINRKIRLPK